MDPATHELLASTKTAAAGDRPFEYFVVQGAGVVDSVEVAPSEQDGSIPWPAQPVPDVPTSTGSDTYPESCSQGGPDLRLWLADGVFDTDCLVVETGADFTIEFHVTDPGVEANISIQDANGTTIFTGEPITGPGTIVYRIGGLTGPEQYVFRSDFDPRPALTGVLWAA